MEPLKTPQEIASIFNLAISDHKKGNLQPALNKYLEILKALPSHKDALYMSGIIYYQLGNTPQAIQNIENAITITPKEADYHANLGLAYAAQNNYDKAIECYSTAISIKAYPETYFNLANAYMNSGKFELAIKYYQNAIKQRPDYYKAYNKLATALQSLGKIEEAIKQVQKAITLNNSDYSIYYNLGKIQRANSQPDKSIESLKTALSIINNQHKTSNTPSKELIIHIYNAIGIAYIDLGQFDNAISSFNEALSIDSSNTEANFCKSTAYLCSGNFKLGWDAYESRIFLGKRTAKRLEELDKIPQWDPESHPKDTPIIILPEQGVGDEIMFSSIISDLENNHNGEITLVCDERLVDIFKRSFKNISISNMKQLNISPSHKKVYLGSLSKYFRKSNSEFKPSSAFIFANNEIKNHFAEKYADIHGLRIGIAWKSGNTTEGFIRSLPLNSWKEMLSTPGCSFFNLQYGDVQQEIDKFTSETGIEIIVDNEVDQLTNIDSFIAQISSLDLIITIDNSTAHIGGALEIPTWVMLPYNCDWRWIRNTSTSLWYKSLKLYRQNKIGIWDSVIKEVVKDLEIISVQSKADSESQFKDEPVQKLSKKNKEQSMETLNTPQEISALLNKAIQYHQDNNLQSALDIYLKVLETSPNNHDALHLAGLTYHQTGNNHLAIKYIKKAISIAPNQAIFYCNLGLIYVAENNTNKAIESFKKAIKITANYPEALFNLGNTYKSIGKTKSAIKYYNQAIKIKPGYAQAYNNLGSTLDETGDTFQAIKQFKKAIKIKPDFYEAIENLNKMQMKSNNKRFSQLSAKGIGLLEKTKDLLKQKKYDEAITQSKKLLSICQDNSDILYFCAMIYLDTKNFDSAIKLLQKAIKLSPENPKYINGLGITLSEKKKSISTINNLKIKTAHETNSASEEYVSYIDNKDFVEAEKAFLKALSLDKNNHLTYHYLGNVQRNLDKYESAISNLNKAIELNPNYKQSYLAIGAVYFSIGANIEAKKVFDSALKNDPNYHEARKNKSYVYISEGDFENGWNQYEFRLQSDELPAENINNIKKIPLWDPHTQPPNTPVIILSEQGVGDEVMYASLISDLCKQHSNEITLVCDTRLIEIYKRSFPNIIVTDLGNLKVSNNHRKIYVGSLPKIIGKTDKGFIQPNGFLTANPEKQTYFFNKYVNIKNLRIGISWKSGNALEGSRRSIPLLNFRNIIANKNCTFFNLQYGDHEQELSQLKSITGLEVINDLEINPLKNLDDYISFMSTLDLIITVDNSTAHFAGAIGIPTWVMLPYSCDWRWMRDREDSIWYKSLKLYRQKEVGDWREALDLIQADLKCFIQNLPKKTINKNQQQKPDYKLGTKSNKKVAFLNDTTSWYHWGCTATSEAIRKRISENGFDGIYVPINHTYNFKQFPQTIEQFDNADFFKQAFSANMHIYNAIEAADCIVINGEGSIHHLSPVSLTLLYIAFATKKFKNKPVHIINHSPYPENLRQPEDNLAFQLYREIYNQLDYIAIREHISHKLMTSYGVNASLSFDCLPITVTEDYKPERIDSDKNIVISGSVSFSKDKAAELEKLMIHFAQQGYKIIILLGSKAFPAQDDIVFVEEIRKLDFKKIEVFDAKSLTEWFDCINSASAFISGRFHHTLAAIFLETPCVMMESNTLKNVAIAETFNMPEPIQFNSDTFFEELLEKAEKAIGSDPVDAELRKKMLARSEVNFEKIKGFR